MPTPEGTEPLDQEDPPSVVRTALPKTPTATHDRLVEQEMAFSGSPVALMGANAQEDPPFEVIAASECELESPATAMQLEAPGHEIPSNAPLPLPEITCDSDQAGEGVPTAYPVEDGRAVTTANEAAEQTTTINTLNRELHLTTASRSRSPAS